MSQSSEDLKERDRKVYLNGIRKFMRKGIPVIIDGQETNEEELGRLFTAPEGSFYMADYVMDEVPVKAGEKAHYLIRENGANEGAYAETTKYRLKEIRFDLAYHS